MSTNNTQQHSTDAVTLLWPDPHFRALLWRGPRINTNQDPFYIKTKNQTQAFSYYFPFYPSSFVSALMVMRVITFNHEIPVPHLTPLCPRHHLQSPECFCPNKKCSDGRQGRWDQGCRKNVSLCAAKMLPKYNEYFRPWSCALYLHSGLWLR